MVAMKGSQAVIQSLEEEGIEVIFGVAGLHAIELYDALAQSQKIKYIAARNEQTAAFMAQGYAESSGKIGVVLVTPGPGAGNTVGATEEAYAGSSRVLQMIGGLATNYLGKRTGCIHDVKDELALFRSIVDDVECVTDVASIPQRIHKSIAKLQVGRPRPTVLYFPNDVLSATSEVSIEFRGETTGSKLDDDLIAQAAKQLIISKRPVIWAGGGVISSTATTELVRLAELLQAPVLLTHKSRGAIPENHPLSLGRSATDEPVRELLAETDVLLAIGTRLGEYATAGWSLELPRNLIHVDIDECEIGKTYPVSLGIQGDAKKVLTALLNQLDGKVGGQRPNRSAEVATIRSRARQAYPPDKLPYVEIAQELRQILSPDAIIVNDVSGVSFRLCDCFQVLRPRTFLMPVGNGTMGYGFSAGIGAKVACPTSDVIAICGDGGFMTSCQELATAVQFGINLVVLVFTNGGYAFLRRVQRDQFDGRYIGVDLLNPDFVKLAESFGAVGIKIRSISELIPALKHGLSAQKPVLIECPSP